MSQFVLTGKVMQRLMASTLDSGSGQRIRVRGRGFSMIPFIRDNCTVILKPVDQQRGIKFGDIVAVSNRKKNRAIIHRVIRSRNRRYQTKGDSNHRPDPWCATEDIIGMVENIEIDHWLPYTGTRWQNILVAVASRTGILTRLIYPGYFHLKSLVKW